MKNLILLSSTLFMAVALTACGGGSTTGSTSNTNASQSSTASGNSDALILNSGRGTSNNQDTEQAQD